MSSLSLINESKSTLENYKSLNHHVKNQSFGESNAHGEHSLIVYYEGHIGQS